MPPATKTINRVLFSWEAPGRAARCQLGLALRNDCEPVEGVAFMLGACVSDGASLT
jgi:hypothetical protein